MGPEVVNKNKNCVFNGPYAGRDMYITMYQDSEREFVVTHNADIKPVSYFTGRETELQDLRQRIEEGRKSVLVSGMGGIGKTHICRKLFEEYLDKHADGEDIPFCHIGYIEYSGDMGSSLQKCLKFKEQDNQEQNQAAAWKELEYLASNGKLLLFVDNVNVPIGEDAGLGRLKQIPGAVVLTSRRVSFSKEFEPYRIGFLSKEQCIKIYERIRYGDSAKKVPEVEMPDLECVIEVMVAGHTITVEFLAHLAETKRWTVKELREELENKGFCLEYKDEEDKLINIQESYETLYDLSGLTEVEQNILEAFSVFPYIPLDAETCNQWLLVDAGVSEENNVLVDLYRKGWLQFDAEEGSYSMHPVFAQFIYEKHKPGLEKHYGLVNGCCKKIEIPEDGSAIEIRNYLPFALNIVKKMNMNNAPEKVELLNAVAYLMQYIGRYQQADEMYMKILMIHEKTKKYSCSDTAVVCQNLAYINIMQKQYEKAKLLCYKSQNLLASTHKSQKNYIIAATNYNNLGYMYQKQKKYDKAKFMYEKCLQIQKNILGERNPSIVRSYNNLAFIHECQNNYIKAEELYKLGMQIYETENTDVALIYNNLAKLYVKKGETKQSLAYLIKSYRILLSKLGNDSERTQIAYNNLQLVYRKLKVDLDFEQWLEKKMKEADLD